MPSSAGPLVFVDRDGVINVDSSNYIRSAAEWVPLPGSLEAIAALTRAGFRVVVISNQSGIGRGLFTAGALDEIHAVMRAAVRAAGGELAGIYFCPHTPADGCHCRKPRPGMLEAAGADFGVSLVGVPFVGDKRSDVDAARAVGARPVLVGVREGEVVPAGVERFPDLAAAAAALIREAEGAQ